MFFRLYLASCLCAAVAFGQDAESHLKAGLALKTQGDRAGAAAEFHRALELNPKLDAAHFYLASMLLEDGHPREALTDLASVPRSPAVDHLQGLAYLESGDPTRAAAYFSHATTAEGHYYLGIALGQQGQVQAALREFKRAVAIKPSFGPAHESLGIALRRQGDNAAALREFQLASRYLPKNPVTLCDLGLALKEAGQFDDAEKALLSALALKPDFERARYALGLVLRMRGQASDAATQMHQVRESHDRRTADAQAHKLVLDGIAAAKAGKGDEAKTAFENAIVFNPDSAEAHYNLAKLLALHGGADDALSELQECLEISPSHLEARMLMGNLYAERNETERAAAAYQAALRIKPEFAEAHNNLGLLWLNTGKKEEAAEEFRTALRLKPDYQAAQYNLNLALQH